MDELRPREREIAAMHEEGMSARRIAARLGVKAASVHAVLAIARPGEHGPDFEAMMIDGSRRLRDAIEQARRQAR